MVRFQWITRKILPLEFAVLIGYARVSTLEQNISLQLEALTSAGCERVYEDRLSGAKSDRPGLAKALDMAREGDTLVVWKLDRLGRSVQHLVGMVADLEKRGIQLKSLTDNIDTGTPSGMFFFHMMASLSQMERSLTIERTRAGLESARRQGRVGGRPRSMTASKVASAKAMLSSGIKHTEVAHNLGISVPTLYRWVPASAG